MPSEICPAHILVRAFFRVRAMHAATGPYQSHPAFT